MQDSDKNYDIQKIKNSKLFQKFIQQEYPAQQHKKPNINSSIEAEQQNLNYNSIKYQLDDKDQIDNTYQLDNKYQLDSKYNHNDINNQHVMIDSNSNEHIINSNQHMVNSNNMNQYRSTEAEHELQYQSELIGDQLIYNTQQQQLDNYNEQLQDLNEKLIQQSTKEQLVEHRIMEYKNQNERLTLQIESLQKQLSNMKGDYEREEQIQHQQIQEYQRKLNDQDQMIIEIKGEMESWRRKCIQESNVRSRLEEENKEMSRNVQDGQMKYQFVQDKFESMDLHCQQLSQQIENQNQEISGLKQTNEQLQQRVKGVSDEQVNIIHQRDKYYLETQNQWQQIQQMQSTIDQKHQSLQQLQSQNRFMEQQLQDVKDQMYYQQQDIQSSTVKEKALKYQIEKLNSEINSIKQILEQKNINIDRLQEANRELQNRNSSDYSYVGSNQNRNMNQTYHINASLVHPQNQVVDQSSSKNIVNDDSNKGGQYYVQKTLKNPNRCLIDRDDNTAAGSRQSDIYRQRKQYNKYADHSQHNSVINDRQQTSQVDISQQNKQQISFVNDRQQNSYMDNRYNNQQTSFINDRQQNKQQTSFINDRQQTSFVDEYQQVLNKSSQNINNHSSTSQNKRRDNQKKQYQKQQQQSQQQNGIDEKTNSKYEVQDIENQLMLTNKQKKDIESEIQKLENGRMKNQATIRRKQELDDQLQEEIKKISQFKRRLKQLGAFYK